ncbi:MAG: aldehyde ferredoxin oxidoreductase family protein [Candidatus Aureabacteria bacterium]|nr:aldehyde ferredoxin oxidoreductase family protein [Candidatus Auribacterota bacterium]
MGYGFWGTLLTVDLTTGKIGQRSIPEDRFRKYLLGSGLAAKLLYDELDIRLDPLAPENSLIFIRGLFNGLVLPGDSKFNVCARSPLTGIWGESAAGGHFHQQFNATGWDGVIFTGASPKPVYLWVNEERVEIRDASHLWGLDTFETSTRLKAETDEKAIVAAIGPSGEKGVLFASIMFDGHIARAAGRCGMGTVMGSKKLKAVVVRGNKKLPVKDPEGLKAALKEQIPKILEAAKGLTDFSTAGGVEAVELHGDLPIKNWYEGSWKEQATKICGQTFIPKTLERHYACFGCPIRCAKIIKLDSGPYAPLFGHAPEYETLAAFGSMCLIDDYEAIMAANETCNRLGMDTISCGGAVAFAIECYEKGVISTNDTDGLELTWGNAPAMVELVGRIGNRSGTLATLLGQGVKQAAEKLGHGSEQWAVHTKGLEYPYHDPRAFTCMAANYATGNRGACHLEALSYFLGRGVPLADMGYTTPPDPHSNEGKGKICYDTQNFQGLFNPLGLCKFLFLGRVGPQWITGWLNYVAGWDITMHDLLHISERLINLKRMYNVRLGIRRKDDKLPPRLATHARPSGGAKGVLPDVDKMVSELYALRGWDKDGIPTQATAARFGLEQEYHLIEKAVTKM